MKCVPDIVYDPQNGLAFDLYLPADLTATACVIYAHGGPQTGGARDGEEVAHVAHALTQAGFAMASVDYRATATPDDFDDKDQGYIDAYAGRSQRAGLSMPGDMNGAPFIAAMEDLSRAVEYLWVEGDQLGIAHRKVGIIGMSLGGIAALGLAYPPTHWTERVARPDAVVAISAAIVQPWRMVPDGGAPCLLINGAQDDVIASTDVDLGIIRAAAVGAPVSQITTSTPGHGAQIDAVLDGRDANGQPYMQMVLDQFARLVED